MESVAALARFSGYSRMQIHRLIKAGRLKLGTAGCYQWALRARRRTGAGLSAKRLMHAASVLSMRAGGTTRKDRDRSGLPHLNSRCIRAVNEKIGTALASVHIPSEGRFHELALDSAALRDNRILVEMMVRFSLMDAEAARSIKTAEDLADTLDQIPLSKGERRVADDLRLRHIGRTSGARFSRKKVPIAKLRLWAKHLQVNPNTKANFRTLANVFGVNVSTLYRWRKHVLSRAIADNSWFSQQ